MRKLPKVPLRPQCVSLEQSGPRRITKSCPLLLDRRSFSTLVRPAESLIFYLRRIADLKQHGIAGTVSPRFASSATKGTSHEDRLAHFRWTIARPDASCEDCWASYMDVVRDRTDLLRDLTLGDFRQLLVVLRKHVHLERRSRVETVCATMNTIGLKLRTYEWNSLMDVMVHDGAVDDARAAFDKMKSNGVPPNTDTFHVLIRCEAVAADTAAASRWIAQMKENGFPVHRIAYINLVKAFIHSRKEELDINAALDAMLAEGLQPNGNNYQTLAAYCLRKQNYAALSVILHRMAADGFRPFNEWYEDQFRYALQNRHVEGLEKLFHCARAAGIKWGKSTCRAYAKCFAELGMPKQIEEVLAELLMTEGSISTREIYVTFLELFCECASLKYVEKILNTMTALGFQHDVRVYSALIRCYTALSDTEAIERAFKDMRKDKVEPTRDMYRHIMQMRSRLGDSEGAQAACNNIISLGTLDFDTAKLLISLGREPLNVEWVTPVLSHWIKTNEPRDKNIYSIITTAMIRAIQSGDVDYALWIHSLYQRLQSFPPPPLFLSFCKLLIKSSHAEVGARVAEYVHFGQGPLTTYIQLVDAAEASNIWLAWTTRRDYRRLLDEAAQAGTLVDAVLSLRDPQTRKLNVTNKTRNSVLGRLLPNHIDAGIRYLSEARLDAIGDKAPCNVILHRLAQHDNLAKAIECFSALRIKCGVYPPTQTANLFLLRLLRESTFAEAEQFVHHMVNAGKQDESVAPNILTYNQMLNACADQKNTVRFYNKYWTDAFQFHRPDVTEYTYATELKLLVNLGMMTKAIKRFTALRAKYRGADVSVWGMLINGYLKLGDPVNAMALKRQMVKAGVVPNIVIYTSLINFYLTRDDPDMITALQDEMLDNKIPMNERTYTSLIAAAARRGDAARAQAVFDRMEAAGMQPDIYVFTALMAAYDRAGNLDKCVSLFDDLPRRRLAPTMRTMNTLLSAHVRSGNVVAVEKLLESMGSKVDTSTYDTLWQSYAAMGDVLRMTAALEKRVQVDPTDPPLASTRAYNTLIAAYAAAGDTAATFDHFHAMLAAGVSPDVRTYTALIRAHALKGDVFGVGEYWAKAQLAGAHPDAVTVTVAVEALLSVNKHDAAVDVLDRAGQMGIALDAIVFNPFVEYWARRNDTARIREVVEGMRNRGVEPNVRVWSTVINALNHANEFEAAWGIWMHLKPPSTTSNDDTPLPVPNPWAVLPASRHDIHADLGALAAILFDLCGFWGAPHRARQLWTEWTTTGAPLSENHLASYVECLCRNKLLEEAVQVVLERSGEPTAGKKTFITLLSFLGKFDRQDLRVRVERYRASRGLNRAVVADGG
ncbi:hypothetical protein DFJ77DRAFT_469205 [Powellomyces hirtus]|nr:hypothetical protein DFJ77DRAFT_469205 [Powellomyces hirtus]